LTLIEHRRGLKPSSEETVVQVWLLLLLLGLGLTEHASCVLLLLRCTEEAATGTLSGTKETAGVLLLLLLLLRLSCAKQAARVLLLLRLCCAK
jgi:hypothetical protein